MNLLRKIENSLIFISLTPGPKGEQLKITETGIAPFGGMGVKKIFGADSIMKHILYFSLVLFYLLPSNLSARIVENLADSGKIEKSTIYKALAFTGTYYATSIYVLNNTWYKDKERVPFHFYNDNAGFLQVDKFGHMFGGYVYSYIGYSGLVKLGATRKEALLFGSTLGFVLQFPIEIMDGLHEGYGFSWGDIVANTMGSALVFGQELLFREQLVKYKFSYWESEYSKNSNGYYGETTMNRLLKDYNGHTYWFSMPINRLVPKYNMPQWLNLAIGYGANGMYGEFENITSYNGVAIPETERYRQYLISLDIDWTRIKTDSKFLQLLFKGMTFVKLPFPALEYNSKGQLKGYWLYY